MLLPNVTLKRSAKRRSISVAVYPDLRVVVSAPLRLPEHQIQKFLHEKSAWLQQKLAVFAATPYQKKREFVDGETFPFLAKPHVLKIDRFKPHGVFRSDALIRVSAPGTRSIKNALIKYYEEKALERLHQRIPYYAALLKVKPKSIGVQSYRGRWGACKSTGELVFNWRLILGNELIFDYVMVHELSHLIHFNHSPEFWNTVESVLPEYKEARKQLKMASACGELDL